MTLFSRFSAHGNTFFSYIYADLRVSRDLLTQFLENLGYHRYNIYKDYAKIFRIIALELS